MPAVIHSVTLHSLSIGLLVFTYHWFWVFPLQPFDWMPDNFMKILEPVVKLTLKVIQPKFKTAVFIEDLHLSEG